MQTLMMDDTDRMDNSEQIQELQRRLELRERQLNALHEINAVFFSQKDLNQGLEETLNILLDTADAAAGSLLLYDRDKRKLVFDKVVGKTELLGQEIDPEQDTTGRASEVLRTGKSTLTLD